MKARTLVLTFAAVAFTVSSALAALPQFQLSDFDTGSALKSMREAAVDMPAAAGAETYDPAYFEIDPASVITEKIDPAFMPLNEVTIPIVKPGDGKNPGELGGGSPSTGGPSAADVDKIINIGERIWKFIENNKPGVNVSSLYANAVPEGTKHWTELEGWSKPERTVYNFSAKNGNGKKVVDVSYIVLRTAGGKKAGKGKFLTGVTVIPLKIDVLWGYKFDMGVEVINVANVGTPEDPLAGMTINLNWTISNNFKVSRGAGVYYIQGDSHFEQVASPFAN